MYVKMSKYPGALRCFSIMAELLMYTLVGKDRAGVVMVTSSSVLYVSGDGDESDSNMSTVGIECSSGGEN